MIVNSHPCVMTRFAEHRAADLRADADRHRLARRAASANGRQPRVGAPTLVAVALALALLLAASRAVVAEPTAQGLLGRVSGAASAAPLVAGDELAISAVQ